MIEAELKQKVAKARHYGKRLRPRNRLEIIITYIVVDDFLRRETKTGRKASHATAKSSPNQKSGGIAGSCFAFEGRRRNFKATTPPAESRETARKVQENGGLIAVKK